MPKIIEINGQTISIGMDDGSIETVPAHTVGWQAKVNDQVDLFKTADKVVVTKKTVGSSSITNFDGEETQVNKMVYMLLTWFLGIFGIHKFYAKKNLQGVIYFILLWVIPTPIVPWIFCLYDLGVAAFRNADDNGMITI